MDLQQERPPAYSHDPESLELPSVPRHDVPAANTTHTFSLPDLKSLGLPEHTHNRTYTIGSDEISPLSQQWQGANPMQNVSHHLQYSHMGQQTTHDSAIASPRAESVMSLDERGHRAPSVLSMDDPDVRMAAEALSGLGNPDYVRSPSNRSMTLPLQSTPGPDTVMVTSDEQEPLLSLITSNYPLVGSTINGSLAAYNTTKHYSPRFIRGTADFVERNVGTPIANTVGTVGRRTGIEGGVRRYLGGSRRPSDLERGRSEEQLAGHKRRRLEGDSEAMDVGDGTTTPPPHVTRRSRGGSQASFGEPLPPYDANRSPQYQEQEPEDELVPSGAVVLAGSPSSAERERARRRHWSTQLMITTSGLGAALSEKSLRNLKYCLRMLHGATSHINSVVNALSMVLRDYQRALSGEGSSAQHSEKQELQLYEREERDRVAERLAAQIKSYSEDIMQTVRSIVGGVSRYTGGALPQNAASVVRHQLLSVPRRWQRATNEASSAETSSSGSETTVRGANRMLAFAQEGIDMIAQVTLVVDGTVNSAENWLNRMGRRKQDGEASGAGEEKQTLPLPVTQPQTNAADRMDVEES